MLRLGNCSRAAIAPGISHLHFFGCTHCQAIRLRALPRPKQIPSFPDQNWGLSLFLPLTYARSRTHPHTQMSAHMQHPPSPQQTHTPPHTPWGRPWPAGPCHCGCR